ncbi:hypothetical protein C8J56DRAFT_450916 [Mycena floridula]|nr:hypothetical protein C8J56DRAFT_450916 [Mycena floridula]
MRVYAARLMHVIPRSALKVDQSKIIPSLKPWKASEATPTVHSILVERREKAGADWPINLRIEPVLNKKSFATVAKPERTKLKKVVSRET